MPTISEYLLSLFDRDMRAVLRNPRAVCLIENPSRRVQLAAVRQDSNVICLIDRPAEDVQLAAVRKFPEAIHFIDSPTERVQSSVVRNNPGYISFLAHPTEKVQLLAVEKTPECISLIRQPTEKGVIGMTNNISVTEASIDEVNVLLKNAETDFLRYRKLYEQESVTRQQYDDVRTRYESLKAKVETMRRQRTGTGIARDEHTIRLSQQEAAIEVARAALDLARLNLGYCTVLAPCDGYTSRKMVQEGELVQPGMRLVSIVDEQKRWIIANFRETQRGGIAVGSRVKITVDAFRGNIFEGRVESISTATGARYSPVAPDNSTGNFVKVEQRIPVKIVFTKNNDHELLEQLTAGMNVECKVMKP